MKFILLISLLTIIGCSNKEIARVPSANNIRLINLINAMDSDLGTNQVLSHGGCARKAAFYYDKLYQMDVNSSQFLTYNQNELRDLYHKSFKIRLEIRNRLKDFSMAKQNSVKCLKSVQNLTRALRYLEDYLVERIESEKLEKYYTTLTGNGSYFKVNPNYNFKSFDDLKSGDVILSRGNAFSSAAIARLGKTDAQFSHMSLVYKDPKGELYTIEAHIEIGVVVMPLRYHIEQKNARTVVFRHKNSTLAHSAAYYMYHKVKKYSEEKGKNINYDFSMNYKDNTDIFCSEVVYDGFYHASNKEVSVPLYKMKFNPKLLNFLQQIGVGVTKKNIYKFSTFGPADIEYDARFELVAEWRDPLKLKKSRIRDAILTKIFDWMENRNYKFKPGVLTNVKSTAGWILRRLGQYEEKFPLNMKIKQLKMFQVLDNVGTVLEKKLQKETQGSNVVSFKEMFSILEKFREEDYKRYKNPLRQSKFHKWFN